MRAIQEKPLITVKTIKRRIFEQIPKREMPLSTSELLGVINDYAMLYREPDGKLYWVHANSLSLNYQADGKIEEARAIIRKAPQIFLD